MTPLAAEFFDDLVRRIEAEQSKRLTRRQLLSSYPEGVEQLAREDAASSHAEAKANLYAEDAR